ncbi:MAG: hypothetical protein IFK93_04305, partial [Acidobacteria bacterium]|nr:hypothetical protein [Candidatus Sulfomarinibacter kjeldsenii]MBD3856789.1 hypothetical protein [Candidatus Sulfomarinibacter kjeldsenii]
AFDRFASINPTLDRIETLDGQPSFEWIYALDELTQPRLLRASARQHAIEPKPFDVESALRWLPGWRRSEEVRAQIPDIKRSRY